MEEQWKTIQGYEYEVSTEGRIRNKKTGRILKLGKNNRGYLNVILYKNGKQKNFLVHRLVAIAFIPNPDNLPQVNHINENKEDNSVDNLEWISHKNNACHGTRGERIAKTRKEKGSCCKKVYCYELDQTFDSIKEAERETGILVASIYQCCRGISKTAGKMHWKYVENK